MASPPISIAANNGSIGGGEVMLLNIAEALRELGERVTVVAPAGDGSMSELADEARSRGFELAALPANSRVEWMRQLRAWDAKSREGMLWCNGLLPAVATAGHRDRIVHLHQRPQSRAQQLMLQLAKPRAITLLVPSEDMAAVVYGSVAFPNWCGDASPDESIARDHALSSQAPARVGFLGRPSLEKGIGTLAESLAELNARGRENYRLVVAGSPKFVERGSATTADEALGAIEQSVDRIGWVKPEELFTQIDVLAVPSITPESFGLVAAEAMSAGMPVVVSDAGALPEVVGEYGTVVRAGDALGLANAITKIVEHPNAAADQVRKLRGRWEELYSPEAGRSRVAELLAELRF